MRPPPSCTQGRGRAAGVVDGGGGGGGGGGEGRGGGRGGRGGGGGGGGGAVLARGGGGVGVERAGRPQRQLCFVYNLAPADTIDKIDPDHLQRNAAVMALMAYLLAERE